MNKLAYTLVFLLPFHALLSTIFRYKLGFDGFWIWKEVLLLIMFIGVLSLKRFKNYKNCISLLVILYAAYMLVSALWAPDLSLNRLLLGTKYDLLFFFALFVGLGLSDMKKPDFDNLLKWLFFGGTFSILIGLILHFIVGPENLVAIGYRNDWSTFYADQAPAFCQRIENSEICRYQGSFAGPNQAGFYLVMYLTVAIYLFRKHVKDGSGLLLLIAGMLGGSTALFFTFSRSAWIAMMIVLVGLLVFDLRKRKKKLCKYILGLIVAGCIGIGTLLNLAPDTIVRPLSNSEHFEKWQSGFEMMSEKLVFGYGLGEAGPSSRILNDNPVISESWFLQVGIQGGLIALIIFMAIYAMIMDETCKSKHEFGPYLLVLFLGMLIPLQLLHAFEDSSFSYSLFLITGIYLANYAKN